MPPSRVWRRWALLVPGLVVAGVLCTFACNSVDESYLRNWCSNHTAPWTMYATAYLGLGCGVGGVVLGWALWLGARRRGWSASSVWQGTLSLVAAGFGVLPIIVELFLAWDPSDSDPSGNGDCGGSAILHGVLTLLS
ncbi:hypothetical protein ACWGCW_30765 [Streptomyces sp. NPDC054933]